MDKEQAVMAKFEGETPNDTSDEAEQPEVELAGQNSIIVEPQTLEENGIPQNSETLDVKEFGSAPGAENAPRRRRVVNYTARLKCQNDVVVVTIMNSDSGDVIEYHLEVKW